MVKYYAQEKRVFDINKLTVVGSPTITSDGVASGFSSGNYIQAPFPKITAETNWEVSISYHLAETRTGNNGLLKYGNMYVYEHGTTGPMYIVYNHWGVYTVFNLGGQDHSKRGMFTLAFGVNGDKHYYKQYYEGNLIKEGEVNNSNKFTCEAGLINLGYNPGIWQGSIDLTAFKIYVDGELVYSPTKPVYSLERRKEGFDLSKFTVIGTPNITEDGVASGFSGSNYLTSNYMLNLSKNFKIKCKINIKNYNQYNFFLSSYGSVIFQLGIIESKLQLSVGDGSTWIARPTSTFTFTNNTDYYIVIEKNNTNYKCLVSIDDTAYSEILNANVDATAIDFKLSLGISRDFSYPFQGSIDLAQFSITVDGKKVFTSAKEKFYLMRGDN